MKKKNTHLNRGKNRLVIESKASLELKSFLNSLLAEQQVPVQYAQSTQELAPVTQPQLKPNSLDQAIDGYLVKYERESIPMSQVYEEIERFDFHIKEQADPAVEEEEPAEEEVPAEDDGGMPDFGLDDDEEEGGAEEAPAPTAPAALPIQATPKIDLNQFAQSVARLTGNYQSLIDPKTLILNRVEQFITNNYDARTAKELMSILDVTYDLRPQEQGVDSTDASRYPTSYTTGGLATG